MIARYSFCVYCWNSFEKDFPSSVAWFSWGTVCTERQNKMLGSFSLFSCCQNKWVASLASSKDDITGEASLPFFFFKCQYALMAQCLWWPSSVGRWSCSPLPWCGGLCTLSCPKLVQTHPGCFLPQHFLWCLLMGNDTETLWSRQMKHLRDRLDVCSGQKVMALVVFSFPFWEIPNIYSVLQQDKWYF